MPLPPGVVVTYTSSSTAMSAAQMNPVSSLATATTALLVCFLWLSFQNFLERRCCAFTAIATTSGF